MGKHYNKEILRDIIRDVIPVSTADWERVALLYQEASREIAIRTVKELKTQWTNVCCNKGRKPTGKAGGPNDYIYQCQAIAKLILNKTYTGTAGDNSTDDDDGDEDEEEDEEEVDENIMFGTAPRNEDVAEQPSGRLPTPTLPNGGANAPPPARAPTPVDVGNIANANKRPAPVTLPTNTPKTKNACITSIPIIVGGLRFGVVRTFYR
jgi:hypothetical protein